jgi:HPt (histidine-containing phosphotransfer) domain-containing protein
MTQDQDRSSDLTVNLPELLTRVDNDRELLRELVDIFKVEFPRLLELLQEQVVRGDLQQVRSTSHGLKGMLGGLSVIRAAAMAARLEQMASDQELSCMANKVTELKLEVEKALPELEASLTEADI